MRHTLGLLLLFMFLLGTTLAPAGAALLPDLFTHWAEGEVRQLVKIDAITGYPDGTFRPQAPITRAEFSTVLFKALEYAAAKDQSLVDIEGHWAQNQIASLVVHGLISPRDYDYHFNPDQPITREEIAKMIARAVTPADIPVVAPLDLPFLDSPDINPLFLESVAHAYSLNFIGGYPDHTFKPRGTSTRAESAVMVVRMLHYLGRIADEEHLYLEELSSFSTQYNPREINRSHNLELAAMTLDNTILAPGEVFSFNRTVGPRTVARGYREALIIIGGRFQPGLGGGICQVSSTLYNAALLAGLSMAERHNHSLAIPYLPPGRDATIAYGSQDLRFKNHMEHPLYIKTFISPGRLTFNFYGHRKYQQHIELSQVTDQVLPFRTERIADPSLRPGQEIVRVAGANGYIARSFRTFYDDQGQVIKREQLTRDYYHPLNRLVYFGPPPKAVEEKENPRPQGEQ